MSVLDSIDTTVTLEWPGRRTIGSLVEVDGHVAVVTALNAPAEGAGLTVTLEGETADEAVAIDGVCLGISETAWGERRIEMELLRVGTVCSASRLRDFVEQYGVASGGSVHIGTSSAHPGQKRFVYHVPERVDHTDQALTASGSVAIGPDLRATLPGRPEFVERANEIGAAMGEHRRSMVQTSQSHGRPVAPTARTGETMPAGSAVMMADDLGLEEEASFDGMPEKTINSDLAAGAFITGGTLDAAFREALRSVEPPRVPEQDAALHRRPTNLVNTSPEMAMDAVPLGTEPGRPVLPDDDLEPTRMIQAMPDDEPDALEDDEDGARDFTATDLSDEEVQRLKAAIDDAIAFERELADSAHHDPDEPIIVNTVPRGVPFAEPVQLGADNRAPTMAQVAPSQPAPEPPPPATPKRNRTTTARIERVAPSLAASLTAPRALEDGENARERKPSGSLRKIQNLFNVDMAIRCDLPATYQLGKKKHAGTLIRLAESRIRLQTEGKSPNLYSRLKVLLSPADGGKNKITLHCEVTRVREPQDDGGQVAFDMRVSPGTTSAKDMVALRALLKSFEAPSAQPPAEASA